MKYFILIFMLFSNIINAQLHDANIYMGNGWNSSNNASKLLKINYNEFKITDIKEPFRNGLIGIGSCSSTYSDSTGNLMFYSNGVQIRNRSNQILENGYMIFANNRYDNSRYDEYGSSVPASTYFLPSSNPRFVNFIFLNDDPKWPNFTYKIAVIDTLLNKVISNKPFTDKDYYPGSIATKHANGRDWWIVMYNIKKNEFSTYLLSDTTITKGSVTKNLNIDSTNQFTEIRFNTKGNKIIQAGLLKPAPQFEGRIFITDFDRCSGVVSNIQLWENGTKGNSDGGGGAIIASLDDSKVYKRVNDPALSSGNLHYLIQYDVSKDYTIKSVDTLFKGRCCNYTGKTDKYWSKDDTAGYYNPTILGIDGRIYYKSSYQTHFGRINFPNRLGKASKNDLQALNLYPCYSWLPYFPNYRLGPIDGSSCDTLGINNNCKAAFRWQGDSALRVEFTDLSYYEPQKWKWDFGDGTTSTDTSPIHTYARSGRYKVCLTVMNANGMDTYCTDVNIINTATETPSYSDHHIVKIYPNPASDFVLIEHEQVHGLCKLKLYDALGQEVHTQYLNIMNTSTIVPLDKLASGMYYYTLTLDGEVQVLDSGKIVVLR
jgi:hypothetical protein